MNNEADTALFDLLVAIHALDARGVVDALSRGAAPDIPAEIVSGRLRLCSSASKRPLGALLSAVLSESQKARGEKIEPENPSASSSTAQSDPVLADDDSALLEAESLAEHGFLEATAAASAAIATALLRCGADVFSPLGPATTSTLMSTIVARLSMPGESTKPALMMCLEAVYSAAVKHLATQVSAKAFAPPSLLPLRSARASPAPASSQLLSDALRMALSGSGCRPMPLSSVPSSTLALVVWASIGSVSSLRSCIALLRLLDSSFAEEALSAASTAGERLVHPRPGESASCSASSLAAEAAVVSAPAAYSAGLLRKVLNSATAVPLGLFSPLTAAVTAGSLPCVQLLIDAGADVNLQPRHHALAADGHSIHDHSDDAAASSARRVDSTGAVGGAEAAAGTEAGVGAGAGAGADATFEADSMLTATGTGASVRKKASKAPPADTALLAAVQQRDVDMVELLLRSGADANQARADSFATTPLLLAASAVPQVSAGASPYANSIGDADADADVDRELDTGASAEEASIAISALLLDYGADPDAGDAFGTTPLHAALLGGHAIMSALLVATGASVRARDSRGRYPWQVLSPGIGPLSVEPLSAAERASLAEGVPPALATSLADRMVSDGGDTLLCVAALHELAWIRRRRALCAWAMAGRSGSTGSSRSSASSAVATALNARPVSARALGAVDPA